MIYDTNHDFVNRYRAKSSGANRTNNNLINQGLFNHLKTNMIEKSKEKLSSPLRGKYLQKPAVAK